MRFFSFVAASCLLFAGVGCRQKSSDPPAAPPTPTYATPEAAFEAFQTAAKQQDFAGAIAVTTIESQQAMAGALVFALGMAAAFDQEQGPEIEKLLEQHGIDPDGPSEPPPGVPLEGPTAMVRMIGSNIKDPAAFIGAAMKFMDNGDDGEGAMEFAAGQLGEVAIDGDQASAMLTIAGTEKPIEFRKSGSGWLIHIPDDEFSMGGGGGEVTMSGGDMDDFEFHFDPYEPLPPPDAITRAAFDQAWQTSVDYSDRVAAEVLTEVAAESGLKLFDQPDMAEMLQQKITLKLDNVSRLQVIEEICRQVDLYPRYKLKTMALAAGPRPYPVAFAGPFLIAVKNLEEYVPYAAGNIELEFVAAGIPTATASQLSALGGISEDDSEDSITLAIPSIPSGDQELLGPASGAAMKMASPSTILFGYSYKLKNLLRDVETVGPISGRLSWPFPSKITKIDLTELTSGAEAEADGVKLKLSKSKLGAASEFTIEIEGAEYDEVKVVGLDAAGEPLVNNFSSSSGFDGTAKIQISIDGKPKSLQARIVAATDRVTYDFEIPAIDLTSFAEMPDQLTELKLDGEQPVGIKFLKLTGREGFRKIKLSVTNRSNKDIHQMQFQFDYLDGQGQVLKQGNGSAMGRRVLVESGQTADVEVHAFFMPAETESVTGVAKWIEFADATGWRGE